jgi:hypothetical protein
MEGYCLFGTAEGPCLDAICLRLGPWQFFLLHLKFILVGHFPLSQVQNGPIV